MNYVHEIHYDSDTLDTLVDVLDLLALPLNWTTVRDEESKSRLLIVWGEAVKTVPHDIKKTSKMWERVHSRHDEHESASEASSAARQGRNAVTYRYDDQTSERVDYDDLVDERGEYPSH